MASGLYKYIHVCTSIFQYVPVYTSMYFPYSSTYQYVLVWVVSLLRRLPWRKGLGVRNKSSVQWRLAGVGKRLRHHRNEVCVWLMSIAVRTSTYWYVPVWTLVYWTLHFLKTDIILAYLLHWSCMLLLFALEELPACMRNLHVMFLVHTSTYQYVLDKKSCTCIYLYVPVHTGTYRYIRFCLILSRCIGFQMRDSDHK
jgi:hypothetical protein